MKNCVLLIVGVLLLALPVGLALADNGPHGGYTATTDACAGCHRTHSAAAPRLLVSAVPNLCYTCHGSGATGANTNVTDGLYAPTNGSLRGGGFSSVYMDADLTGPQTLAVTSRHEGSGGSNTVWGYGSLSSTPDPGITGVALSCTNCHNPHGRAGAGGTATYRILKGNNAGNQPLFDNGTVTQTASVDVPDEATKTYTGNSNYWRNYHYPQVGGVWISSALTRWCAQCHARHKPVNTQAIPGRSGRTDSGDAIYAFRHATNIEDNLGCTGCHSMAHGNFMPPYPACVTCHVAHGTGVRMGTYSGAIPWPDGTTTPGGNNRSSLLRLDNRGVCQECHNK